MEVIEVQSREINGENGKKELKNQVFSFHMNMRKIHTIVQNETEMILATAQKMKSENRFRMTMRKFRTVMRNALGRQKWC